MSAFVRLSVAPGYPGVITERGPLRIGDVLTVPLDFAEVLVAREPAAWVVEPVTNAPADAGNGGSADV